MAVVVVGTIAATAIALLAFTAANPHLYAKLELLHARISPETADDRPHLFIALLYVSGLGLLSFILGVVIAALLLASRIATRRRVAVAWGLVACLLFYLVQDEPLHTRDFLPIKPVAATPAEKEAHEHLMLYGNHHPEGRDFAVSVELTFPSTDDRAAHVAWLKRERANIERGWDELADLRAWWDELDQYETIPDLCEGGPTSEILAFKPYRAYSRFGGAKAHLLALDGHRDEAVALLLPALQVGIRLQANPHTAVRAMIGLITEKGAIDHLGLIVDEGGISEPLCHQLRTILLSDPGPPGLRQLVESERWNQAALFNIARPYDLMKAQQPSGALIGWYVPLELTTCMVYNPHRTMNAQARQTADMIAAAGRRDLKRVKELEKAVMEPAPHFSFKNGYGEVVMSSVNAYLAKIIEAFWKKEDARIALLKKLETAPLESALPH